MRRAWPLAVESPPPSVRTHTGCRAGHRRRWELGRPGGRRFPSRCGSFYNVWGNTSHWSVNVTARSGAAQTHVSSELTERST